MLNGLIQFGNLARGGVENWDEGEQQNVARKCIGSERLTELK
jgi:hypothetical protein